MKNKCITILLIVLMSQNAKSIFGKSQFCEVETGQTNIILDIEESRGNDINQFTNPSELPVYGDPFTEIALELVFQKGNPTFLLNGKKLQLLAPLDRDDENLSHIVFQVSCTVRSSKKKRNIPVIVRVSDVNDNPPVFTNTPYQTTVPESTPIGTTIFSNILAVDKDAGINGLVEYFLVEGNRNMTEDNTLTAADGFGTFAIAFPHQGQVTLVKSLDYERIQKYYVTIVASDRARNITERLSSTTTLTINVADSDDLDPSFIYQGCVILDGACINPEYSASVPAGSLQGVLNVSPERIQAVDLDTISSPVRYYFESGMPSNYKDYFEIDEQTGVLKQIKAVDTSTAKKYDIIVRAEEVSEAKRYTTAKLTIAVKPVDANPPMISASSTEGFVEENSPIGTKVLNAAGETITFTVTDLDFSEDDIGPEYIFELTTPSFVVTKNKVLVVNEDNLDRDPPNPGKYTFQVVAREAATNAASAPLSITVFLKDVNDNPPKIPSMPPVSITAGIGRRFVTKITATDNDEKENAIITYSIYHVSNNGGNKFSIDENTGEIETRGRLLAGEQYSITIQASDKGGLYTQSIIEVSVTPGPNTKPPHFLKPVYEVQVSEGAEINSTVTVVKAEDPENDPVTYSIISGNDLRQFSVGQDTGVITVIRKLDRESLTRYQLIVKAADNGGLSNTATVNIKVTDINDKNPEFDESMLPYIFKVNEGEADIFVGMVHATDADEGVNAQITYSIPSDIPFVIDSESGEIKTKTKLDYETQSEYKFVVTAKDGAPDARLGTASVIVQVIDLQDEVPKFVESKIDVKVPENVPDLLVATVKAVDPDTIKNITYVLRKGLNDLFKIDSKSGEIKTIRGLDYEKEKSHELIVGTLENTGESLGDYVKIIVEVDDRNDIPPVFVSVPEPITVNDDQPIGAVIAAMPAIDGDGSSPGNVVRYEMVGRGKALKYFQIDPDTGAIRIRDELRKEDDTEYQVDVRAYDLGDPQLSSVATLPIYVRHLLIDPNETITETKVDGNMITNSETLGLAFSDDSYTAEVSENSPLNSTIKLIQIINSKKAPKSNAGFKCEIVGGNFLDLFEISLDTHACALSLKSPLDFENKTSHELEIKLISYKYFVNPQKNEAKVKIIVQDENDNSPKFIFEKLRGRNDTFYTVVNPNTEIDTPILQVKAVDHDSGKFGMIKYRLFEDEDVSSSSEDQPSSYFSIMEDTGILKTQRVVRDVKDTPLKFFVEARDNNGEAEASHKATARIVVNMITDDNRLRLVFLDSSPTEIKTHHTELEQLLEEKTDDLIVRIEKFSNRKILNENGSIIENSSETDMWFYVIDPETEKIFSRNSNILIQNFLEPSVQSVINFAASGIARATAQGIYAPLQPKQQIQKVKTAMAIHDDLFPYILIGISVIILFLGIIGIIYICVSWSKYKNFKERMRQYSVPSSPTRYDPVIVGSQNGDPVSAHLKEYETQVLAMAIPPDGDEDLQLDFSAKNHAFSLDNVSYITRKENGQSSPAHSEATTATTATLRRNNNNNINNINNNVNNNHNFNNNVNNSNRQNTFNRTLEINRNNHTNPLAAGNSSNITGTLTLGRLKQSTNHYQNGGYKLDTLSRNNSQIIPNNAYSTLGRRGNTFHQNFEIQNDLVFNTHGRNSRYTDMPISNSLFQIRSLQEQNHLSPTNENVTFSKRDYGHLGFSYLNDLDQSEVETTTEL